MIRLEKQPFELNGKTYQICCNMNVLADIQEAFEGNLNAALNDRNSLRSALIILAAMLNDANEAAGDPERFQPKQLGNMLGYRDLVEAGHLVFGLVIRALIPEHREQEAEEKN